MNNLTIFSFPEKLDKGNISTVLFVISVNAVKNQTADTLNDVLHDDIIKEVPDEVKGITF